jgi:hypothetical protein
MNVINLSLGEPEITLTRHRRPGDRRSGQRGVVPVIAAGNDFDALGFGSIDSPGSAPGDHGGSGDEGGRDRELLFRRPHAILAAPEAGRRGAGRLDPLVGPFPLWHVA